MSSPIRPKDQTPANNQIPADLPPIPDPVSACDIVRSMLRQAAQITTQQTGGGFGVGFRDITYREAQTITSLDDDTNRLIRADVACRLGLFHLRDRFGNSCYVSREDYEEKTRKRLYEEAQTKQKSDDCVIT